MFDAIVTNLYYALLVLTIAAHVFLWCVCRRIRKQCKAVRAEVESYHYKINEALSSTDDPELVVRTMTDWMGPMPKS